MEDNDKNLNKNPQEIPSEDRKLGRAPLSVSEKEAYLFFNML